MGELACERRGYCLCARLECLHVRFNLKLRGFHYVRLRAKHLSLGLVSLVRH